MFEKADESDLEAIVEIEKKTFNNPWTKHSILESIKRNEILVFRNKKSDELQHSRFCSNDLVGFLIFQQVVDEVSLLQVSIDPELQGNGFGKILCQFWLKTLSDEVKTIWVEVRASNVIAQSMYRSLGFKKCSERKGYYTKSDTKKKEDAYIYKLKK